MNMTARRDLFGNIPDFEKSASTFAGATKVPDPCLRTSNPSWVNSLSARLTVMRDACIKATSSCSVGT